jgi:hypothetical protein
VAWYSGIDEICRLIDLYCLHPSPP